MYYRDSELAQIFHQYCSFGSRTASVNALTDDVMMDNARFAKLAKECKLVDKINTLTDIDIIFNKVRDKGARRIDFAAFKEALLLLAERKYANNTDIDDPYYAMADFIVKHGKNGPALNTGSSEKLNKASTDKVQKASTENLKKPAELTKRKSEFGSKASISAKSYGSLAQNPPAPSTDNTRRASEAPKTKTSVFQRLTDVGGYTGAHKERFNADGTGKGIAGRDAVPKGKAPGPYRGGDVKELSQILRT